MLMALMGMLYERGRSGSRGTARKESLGGGDVDEVA